MCFCGCILEKASVAMGGLGVQFPQKSDHQFISTLKKLLIAKRKITSFL
jgi:hypothetical protein